MKRLMKIFHLIICHFSSLFDSLLQVLNSDVSFFESIMHLCLHALVFSLLSLHDLVLFFELFLNLFLFFLQLVDDRGVPLLNIFDVSSMDFGYSLFDVVDL